MEYEISQTDDTCRRQALCVLQLSATAAERTVCIKQAAKHGISSDQSIACSNDSITRTSPLWGLVVSKKATCSICATFSQVRVHVHITTALGNLLQLQLADLGSWQHHFATPLHSGGVIQFQSLCHSIRPIVPVFQLVPVNICPHQSLLYVLHNMCTTSFTPATAQRAEQDECRRLGAHQEKNDSHYR